MNRKQVLELIKLAIADGDTQTATRLYCDNRISRVAFDNACYLGEQLKAKLNNRSSKNTTFADL